MNQTEVLSQLRKGSIKYKVLSVLSADETTDVIVAKKARISLSKAKRTLMSLRAEGFAGSRLVDGRNVWKFDYSEDLLPWEPTEGQVDADIKRVLEAHGPLTAAEAADLLPAQDRITITTRLPGLALRRRIRRSKVDGVFVYFMPAQTAPVAKPEAAASPVSNIAEGLINLPKEGTIRFNVLKAVAQAADGLSIGELLITLKLQRLQVQHALSGLRMLGLVRNANAKWYGTALTPAFEEELPPEAGSDLPFDAVVDSPLAAEAKADIQKVLAEVQAEGDEEERRAIVRGSTRRGQEPAELSTEERLLAVLDGIDTRLWELNETLKNGFENVVIALQRSRS